MIKKVFSLFIENERIYAYLLVLLLVIAAVLEMFGVGLIMPFIALIQSPDLVEKNKWAKLAFDALRASSYSNFIILCSLVILIFYLVKNLIVGLIIFWQSRFLARSESRLAVGLLSRYLAMPYERFLARNSAELVNNIAVETANLFAGLVKPLFIVISDSLVVVAILCLLIYVAPGATFAAMGSVGICSLIFYLLLRKRLRELGQKRQHHKEQMVQWVNQSLGSLKEIVVLGREKFFIDRFWHHAHEMIGQQTFYETVTQLPRIVIESFGVIVLVLITIILINQQGDFLPTISLFAMAAFRLMPAVNRITSSATKIRYYNHMLDMIYNDYKGLAGSNNFNINNQNSQPHEGFKKEILIDNIAYAYPGTDKQVLTNLSLLIKKGDSVGIIGSSGAGKSTLIDILLGLLKPQHGNILVDGVDINNNLDNWRKEISYMPQVVYLTDDTIKRNVALGIADEDIDEELVWECLRKAHADEFVRNMENGLETFVGERGGRLSGGQRQRIGIARSLYNKPSILVLDEATTALDPKTEALICKTLKEIATNITVIAISHQPALIAITNRVYTMQDGTLGIVNNES